MPVVLAIDAGTTGVRTLAFDSSGVVVDAAYRELTQHYPRPGWVEHDASEIWAHVGDTLREVAGRRADEGEAVAAIGVTNQRETLVAWDTSTGQVAMRAIVWQDRRSARVCDELEASGAGPAVRRTTGLVLDPYFTATKMAWLLREGDVEVSRHLVMTTVDAWVTWNLTGGSSGGVVATDATNASRTLLYDINSRGWSAEMAELFGVPVSVLPAVVPSCGRVGAVSADVSAGIGSLAGVPVSGIAGDQHAALFGQACFSPGMAKVTNGTGSFVLLNVGAGVPEPVDCVLTTVGWDLGEEGSGDESFVYALEGSVFATGAAIQWLRDGLGIIESASETGPLAESVPDTGGVFFVPAFTGLGSPWWDPYARGTIVGVTRGIGRAEMARAVVESMAFQVRDVIDAMRGTVEPRVLRADGGASVMDVLLQLLADQVQVRTARPATTETTALGAAALAGLAEGVWGSLDELASLWRLEREFEPRSSRAGADAKHAGWVRAVERSRRWA